jgi:hypothetical protein
MRDFRRLQNDPPTGVQGAPLDNNIMVRETDLGTTFPCLSLSLVPSVSAEK